MAFKDSEKLASANENGWYVLATIFGEQPFRGDGLDLHKKNTRAWNGVMSKLIDNKSKIVVAKTKENLDVSPLSADEFGEIDRILRGRIGKGVDEFLALQDVIAFEKLRFDRTLRMDGFVFPVEVLVANCVAPNGVSINGGVFLADFKFKDLQLEGGIGFSGAVFCGTSCFCEVEISGNSDFFNCEFSRDASFNQSKFVDGLVSFVESKFMNKATIEDVIFGGRVDFQVAQFHGDVSFHNTEFKHGVSFARAIFKEEAPDFRGAKMHAATDWHGVTWPGRPINRKAALRQIDRYGRLKQEMALLKKSDLERSFFRLELRARRFTSEKMLHALSYRLFNFLYDYTSNYGDSFIRPMRYFAYTYILGVFVYRNFFYYNNSSIDFYDSMKICTAIMFPFFPGKPALLAPSVFDSQYFVIHVFAVFQASLGYIFMFLAALAFRNRFGMK